MRAARRVSGGSSVPSREPILKYRRGSSDKRSGIDLHMLSIIGIVIVLGAIAAGYTMEHGSFRVLMQPAELVIIFGAAIGTLVVANPLPTLIKIGKGLAGVFSGSRFTKALYLESLKMLYELFALSRKAGTAKLEEEVDNPAKGMVLKKYPNFMNDHHALQFLCDTLRTVVTGGVDAMEIDTMMEMDLEVLMCYGIFGPLAIAMGKNSEAESDYLGFLRMAALGFIKDLSPIMAIELARRSIPNEVRQIGRAS